MRPPRAPDQRTVRPPQRTPARPRLRTRLIHLPVRSRKTAFISATADYVPDSSECRLPEHSKICIWLRAETRELVLLVACHHWSREIRQRLVRDNRARIAFHQRLSHVLSADFSRGLA